VDARAGRIQQTRSVGEQRRYLTVIGDAALFGDSLRAPCHDGSS
jgi:hypothetical protein